MPDVFDYENHREFLKDFFSRRYPDVSSPSLRAIAMRAGFRSPALLSMIMNGKRGLTLDAAERISKALALTGNRKHYFLILARKDMARSDTEIAEASQRLARLRKQHEENPLHIPQYRILALWYVPVIYTLVGLKTFRADSKLLSKQIGRGITKRQVELALQDLQSLKLVEEVDRIWKQTNASLKTDDDFKHSAIIDYHRQMINLAKHALKLPSNERDISGITVCIPKSQIGVVKSRIRQFRKNLNEYLSQFDVAEEVYQINIQLFPLTKKLSEEK